MSTVKKRNYNSENRQLKAKQTRAKILKTANKLFVTKGYDKVTLVALAKAAGVSLPTVYALFKSKLGVLSAVLDECFPEEDHTALVKQGEGKPAKEQLAIAAKIARKIYEAESKQINLLQGAGALSKELKQLEQTKEKRRYQRLASTVKALFTAGELKTGFSQKKAHDVFWALTGRDMFRLLVIERAWSATTYEKWLVDCLVDSLLR
jgi:AcrR family transcriptional regulator